MELKQLELCITQGATHPQRETFLKRKEPFVKASWERYINNLNKEASRK